MGIRPYVVSLAAMLAVSFAAGTMAAPAVSPTREITTISSAGARAMVDACTAWAEENNMVLAMAVLDWGGNLIESHAMEGTFPNSIDTALLKAKNALRWRRPSSETAQIVRSGQNFAPTYIEGDFPQPGGMPVIIDGELLGSMGVSSAQGEQCAQVAINAVFNGQKSASAR